MIARDLIETLRRYADFPMKMSTGILDENGIDIIDVILQEYDDGKLEYELVLIGDHNE